MKVTLTDRQLEIIYGLAIDAYEAQGSNLANRNAYAIYIALNAITGEDLLISEGWGVVYCNGADSPPTREGIASYLADVKAFRLPPRS